MNGDKAKPREPGLTDLNKVPPHMRMDYQTRNENILAGVALCGWCEGTGNEMYSMYRACPKCGGTGRKPSPEGGKERS